MSTAGILALLSEDDPTLLSYALSQLNSSLINSFWAEISDSISSIEVVSENNDLPRDTRQLAALLASKVYYHLGSLDDALSYALNAGDVFKVAGGDANGDQDYTDTIIATCIDKYVEVKGAEEEGSSTASTSLMDSNTQDMDRMQAIVEQMFQRCIQDKEYKQAMGIALDARRLDVIEKVFQETKDSSLLLYVLDAVMTILLKLDFRNKVREPARLPRTTRIKILTTRAPYKRIYRSSVFSSSSSLNFPRPTTSA